MEKRYQVFISSTFADLQDERKAIMEAIMDLNCFPAGMEMFPANDSEQFEYIKTIIDESDYYVLVLAGRYGSVAEDGKSYTEKEFDYAKEKGIPVLVFAKKDLENIPVGKTDNDPEKKKKLEVFREKAMGNKLAKYWETSDELKYNVLSSLSRSFKTHQRTGWIKGNLENNEELLKQINKLRIENERLRTLVKKSEEECCVSVDNLACGDDKLKLRVLIETEEYFDQEYDLTVTWNEIINIICSYLITNKSESSLKSYLQDTFSSKFIPDCESVDISIYDFNRIKIQLMALGLITQNGSVLSLTDKGKKFVFLNYTIKKA
ncbi:DUF4062 domain-containing protein [Clostridium perfringens]|uniref:DUF4062 domain-containing protein n=1 Tax=Clostridium perfringens TaxID=1502 RepID=UPI0024BC8BAB|nr:DUF4062 domain-containing protein [Clostridium perfringens]